MFKPSYKSKRFQLAIMFAGIIFIILVSTIFILAIGIFLLQQRGLHIFEKTEQFPFFGLGVASLIIGTLIAFPFGKIALRPIRAVCKAADKIANGDYSIRINLKGPAELTQLSDSFNHMAEELGSVEMLRSDFVNNFSHEFKTPIVSIRGFAKMLKCDDLTNEERREYIDTIITESERLSELSTSILNLTKIEQQSILTNSSRFNVSEQIRLVIAMLSEKWQKKSLEFDYDCGEIDLIGNEEMLKQVWINLLDNAIKFSPASGTISIRVHCTVNSVIITVSNAGHTLTPEQAAHIFDKFYQTDKSHTASGFGIGLAIVKRIVELHSGTIFVDTKKEGYVTFRVEMPRIDFPAS